LAQIVYCHRFFDNIPLGSRKISSCVTVHAMQAMGMAIRKR
jgi:hypothetical protein